MKRFLALMCTLALAATALVPLTRAKYVTGASYTINVITQPPSYDSTYFPFAASPQPYTATADGYYAVQLWGADGGNGNALTGEGGTGGSGAYIAGSIWLAKDDVVYFMIGNRGRDGDTVNSSAGGNNGGGGGGFSDGTGGGGGGGAADLRVGGSSLGHRVMVAAGGGGGGGSARAISWAMGGTGGAGGADTVPETTNGAGVCGFFMPGQDGGGGSGSIYTGALAGYADAGGQGSTVTSYHEDVNGSFGQGGHGSGFGGGGGGGWYGGGGGGGDLSITGAEGGGGGGGCSFIDTSVGDASQLPSQLWSMLPKREDYPYYHMMVGWGFGIITYLGTVLPAASADPFTSFYTLLPDEGMADPSLYAEEEGEPELYEEELLEQGLLEAESIPLPGDSMAVPEPVPGPEPEPEPPPEAEPPAGDSVQPEDTP